MNASIGFRLTLRACSEISHTCDCLILAWPKAGGYADGRSCTRVPARLAAVAAGLMSVHLRWLPYVALRLTAILLFVVVYHATNAYSSPVRVAAPAVETEGYMACGHETHLRGLGRERHCRFCRIFVFLLSVPVALMEGIRASIAGRLARHKATGTDECRVEGQHARQGGVHG